MIMTIKEVFNKTGIEGLPIFNVCTETYWMLKDVVKEHIYLEDSMFDVGFENEDEEEDETEIEIPGRICLGQVINKLESLFAEFCEENELDDQKASYIRYAGKIPKDPDAYEGRIEEALKKLNTSPEELADFLEGLVPLAKKYCEKQSLQELAYRKDKEEYLKEDAIAAICNLQDDCRCVVTSDELIDDCIPDLYSLSDKKSVILARDTADKLVREFQKHHDCNIAENDMWEHIVEHHIKKV